MYKVHKVTGSIAVAECRVLRDPLWVVCLAASYPGSIVVYTRRPQGKALGGRGKPSHESRLGSRMVTQCVWDVWSSDACLLSPLS